MIMTRLGVHEWCHHQQGCHWIVTLPCDHDQHDAEIVRWCKHEFGYVDPGVVRIRISQDFWFKSESEALLCWLTWGMP